MTDLKAAPAWHTTSGDEITELRRRLADAELRTMNAVAAEDVAQFAFETAKRRADTAENALRALLIEYVIEPRIPVDYPEMTSEAAERIADAVIDGLDEGTDMGDLDVAGHIEALVAESGLLQLTKARRVVAELPPAPTFAFEGLDDEEDSPW